MSTKLEILGLAAAAATVGTIYVLVHEARRKHKKAVKLAREAPISKEMLLTILNKSADASRAVIERIRVEVRKIQQAKNLPDEQAMQLFQQNFEHSLDQLIGAIRNQYNVTEKAMDASFKMHQSDPEVQAAVQNMRMLSASTPIQRQGSPTARSGSGGGGGSGGGTASVPSSLTKERLREVMTFHAVMLEKELRPIKDELEKVRREGKQAQVDPNVLFAIQTRISQAVQERFSVTDDQVMAAVEKHGAKNDPSFKDIMARLASSLNALQ